MNQRAEEVIVSAQEMSRMVVKSSNESWGCPVVSLLGSDRLFLDSRYDFGVDSG